MSVIQMQVEKDFYVATNMQPCAAIMHAIAVVVVEGVGEGILLPLAAKGDLSQVLLNYPLPRMIEDDAKHLLRLLLRACTQANVVVSHAPCPAPEPPP